MHIRLTLGEWEFDPTRPLGNPGGFGAVFCGESSVYGPLAIKQLKISAHDAAHREMRIANDLAGKVFSHVVPIHDAGLDAESDGYFVVMARAEKSLQQVLDTGTRFSDMETVSILRDIAAGLSNVPQLVHRDLKPGNVLLHNGAWKLADFGIAKFVEDSTSLNTLRGSLTPGYAAPEQWRGETATVATDLYALGCIGYALKTGKPPFGGSWDECQQKHLFEIPPELDGSSDRLRSLLSMMLRKVPSARPSLHRVQTILEQLANDLLSPPKLPVADALARISAALTAGEAKSEAAAVSLRDRRAHRESWSKEAERILKTDIIEPFFNHILSAAPACKRDSRELQLQMGKAELRFKLRGNATPENGFSQSKWEVISAASIAIAQSEPFYEWSSSLWYTNLGKGNDFRWYEVSYMNNPLGRTRRPFQPFDLTNDIANADQAAAPAMGMFQFAYGPIAIDDELFDKFVERWANRFVVACEGKLTYPRNLPLL